MLRCICQTASNVLAQPAGHNSSARRGLLTATASSTTRAGMATFRVVVPSSTTMGCVSSARGVATTSAHSPRSLMRHAQARSFSLGDKKEGAVVGGVKTGTAEPLDTPPEKEHELCILTADYHLKTWWVVHGDLAKAHKYGVKWGKLYVCWKEGEDAEIIEDYMSEVDSGGDMFKRPLETTVKYEHYMLDEYRGCIKEFEDNGDAEGKDAEGGKK